MNSLMTIWWLCLVLASLAVATLALLLIRRRIDENGQAKARQARLAIQTILFQFLISDESLSESRLQSLSQFRRRDQRELRQLSIDLFHLIKGTEQRRLSRVLDRIGLQQDCLGDLRSKDVRTRRLAAEALQIFDDETSRTALLQALEDPDPDTRVAAADSLLVRGHLPDIHFLMSRLTPAIRLQSRDLRTLFRDIARLQPKDLNKRVNAGGLSRNEKLLIAEALAFAADYQLLDVLKTWARDPDAELRATAVRSLATLQHPAAEAEIRAALTDMNWQVRAVAARAAGRIHLQSCESALNYLMDDRNWWVRFRAAEALFRLGESGVNVLLVRAHYAGCGGFGRGARMAALVLNEHGIGALTEQIDVPALGVQSG